MWLRRTGSCRLTVPQVLQSRCRPAGDVACGMTREDDDAVASALGKGKQIGPRWLFDHLDEVAHFAGRPRLALAVDFDGTLAEFAPTPAEATIHPGCARALASLAQKLVRVMVLSGRGVRDLADHVDIQGLCYAGNHGAEYLCGGVHRIMPGAEAGSGQVRAILDYLKSKVGDPALIWEDKVFSASVHYRRVQDAADVVRALQAALAGAPGHDELELFWGNKVLEIRPRTGLNKGHAIRRLIGETSVDSVMFIGDDTTDVDGMRAIREARDSKRAETLGVVVARPGTPKALTELADYRVGSVADVGRFLGWLDSLRNG